MFNYSIFFRIIVFTFLWFVANPIVAQNYKFEDFLGTWHGTYSSEWSGISESTITIHFYNDSTYIETPGYLMPSIYKDTQKWDYDKVTNRLHLWYLRTVYAGQRTYTHIYYEVISFRNDTLEMHYNFWNEGANPEAGRIFLVKESSNLPAPQLLEYDIIDDKLLLNWNAPDNVEDAVSKLVGYNIYGKYENEDYKLISFTEENSFLIDNSYAGVNSFYVTAKYEDGESLPSNEIYIIFHTPEPQSLEADLMSNNISLSWKKGKKDELPIATLVGYNVYYSLDEGEYQLIEFTDKLDFYHKDLSVGTHKYYVTAVYQGGESEHSNEIELLIEPSSVESISGTELINIYPNPASEFIRINSLEEIKSISIINQLGHSVFFAESYKPIIDLSNFNSGSYIIKLNTSSGIYYGKFIKD